MGSCPKCREEMNETVGVEANFNSSEIEKEIAVVGDPTGDIMIDDIMDGGDDLIFSAEGLFTSLPDFACLSSPAPSSASINLPQNPSVSSSSSSPSSSSSSAPWTYIDVPGPAQETSMQQQSQDQMAVPSAEAAADDIFADFGLRDPSNPLDPSVLFADYYDAALEAPLQHCVEDQTAIGNGVGNSNGGSGDNNEMGKIFFEWLINNRDAISVEELRSIKLRRSTIDCASARLGSGEKGRQELLRLVLAWVQNHHPSKVKKRRMEAQVPPPESVPQFYNNYQAQQQQVAPSLPSPSYNPPHYQFPAFSDATANPNPNPNLNYSNCEGVWSMHYGAVENQMPPFPAMPLMMVSTGNAASMNAYHQYYQSGSTTSIVVSSQPLSSSPDFRPFSPPPIQYPPFPDLGIPCPNPIMQYSGGFGSQYPVKPIPALTGAALATKEARKMRMARQRRSSVLHQHKHRSRSQNSSLNAVTGGKKVNLRPGTEGEGSSLSTHNTTSNNVKNCAFWSSGRHLPTNAATVGSAPLLPPKTSNMQQSLLQPRNGASSDKLQGPKKNLKFLLQKVLKQSDVGSLGRIVLPKKEAEIQLPELDSGDGMSIPMEDIGTSRVWNMKYRFWPNNRSRMYLLENTGDFIRSNGLQEGDFIVIYSDVMRNKYMIRGVKVRQPAEPKEVAAAGISLNVARANLKNSSDHLNGTSRTAAVSDLEKNEQRE